MSYDIAIAKHLEYYSSKLWVFYVILDGHSYSNYHKLQSV